METATQNSTEKTTSTDQERQSFLDKLKVLLDTAPKGVDTFCFAVSDFEGGKKRVLIGHSEGEAESIVRMLSKVAHTNSSVKNVIIATTFTIL